MDALTIRSHDLDFLKRNKLLYLYCVDFYFSQNFKIESLPFMDLKLVGGHVSFPQSLHGRRIVFFPNGTMIRNLAQEASPCCHIVVSIFYCSKYKLYPLITLLTCMHDHHYAYVLMYIYFKNVTVYKIQ